MHPMAFQITTVQTFCASHQLRLYHGELEPLHGHNWRVRLTVSAAGLDSIGVVMDFHKLDRLLGSVLKELDNHHLNDVLPTNPSAENVAAHVASRLVLPRRVNLVSVEVWETPENSALYLP